MTAQWPAVGAEIDPITRARQLQKSWERLLADGALAPELPPEATAGLRPTIVDSWRRSLATGLDPTDLLAPIVADESEVLERWFEHPLGSLTHVIAELLGTVAQESRSIVVVTDAAGIVLHRVGDEWLKECASETMNLVEGAHYSEASDGTNGIGTALAADQPYQVFAFEHFNERHHQWVCSAAPVHDPVSGQTIGLIDVSCLWKIAHPRSLELVTSAARTIEQCLLDARRERDTRLRRRYCDFMTRRSDLLVDREGYLLDGGEPPQRSPFEIPEGGGEIVLSDGSGAIAAPLGQGEAYLLRRTTTRRTRSTGRVGGLQRAEERARELAIEQAALRQVATLVAREPSPDQLFGVVAEQVARIFDVPDVRLVRYEPNGSLVIGGFSEGDHEPFQIGSRVPLDSPGVVATVRQTGRAARVEDYAHIPGEAAAVVRGAGIRSAFASPIVVERRLWGAIVVLSPRLEPFPEGTEARLTDFTELVATAISNAESRQALAELADEQAALRRVAELVARQPSPTEVFTAVTQVVGQLLGADLAVLHAFSGDGTATTIASWSGDGPVLPTGTRFPLHGDNLAARIFESGAPARMHSNDEAWERAATGLALSLHVRSAVGAPILVDGKLWGALMAATRHVEPWAENVESRIAAFTELVATTIANAESREALAELADEQAVLRRVATLVAQGVSPQDLFEAVAGEVGRLLPVDSATMGRFEPDGNITTVASWSTTEAAFPTGRRWPTEGTNVVWMVAQTGESARLDDFSAATDPIGVSAREAGIKSAVGSPIVVEGHLWGIITAASTEGPMPPGAETRLASFTELVATSIANAESQRALERLADEQAALRRVATLVAEDVSPSEIFSAVSNEVSRLFDAASTVSKFESDGSGVVVVAAAGFDLPVGTRFGFHEALASGEVYRTGRPARVDGFDWSSATGRAAAARRFGVVSTVASPIVVEGRGWGVMGVHSTDDVLPRDTEDRLANFAQLVATAVANAESRTDLAASEARAHDLATEQAALRRMATLVAEDVPPSEIFSAVSTEVGRLFDVASTVNKYDNDGSSVVVVAAAGFDFPIGTRWDLHEGLASAEVYRTGHPARVDDLDWSSETGPLAAVARRLGVVSTVASPIVVEGRLWGAMTVHSTECLLPHDTENRLANFSQLVATAVANAENKAELAASRRRIVAASDEARRRIERDLHDGIQQQLVALSLRARASSGKPPDELSGLMAELADGLGGVADELREVSRGIHPTVLTKAGLGPALRALGRRSGIPIELDVTVDGRLPEPVEVAAYYVASEALTNAAKHSRATVVHVVAAHDGCVLALEVRDDGVGGARDGDGSGIVGLIDRVEALGGTITITSPLGAGTTLSMRLPTALEPPP